MFVNTFSQHWRPDASKIYSAEKTKGLMILLCWYGAKDQYFILLPGHILYRKARRLQTSLYTGQIQKLLQCCQKNIPTDFSCYNDSEEV